LRRSVQWVTPALPLMRASLRRNLRYAARIKAPYLQRISQLCGLAAAEFDAPDAALSSSMAARVRLARALATRPGLLLIDDAAFLYDPAARQALLNVKKSCDVTLVIATPSVSCVTEFKPDLVWHLSTDSASPAGISSVLCQEAFIHDARPCVVPVKASLAG